MMTKAQLSLEALVILAILSIYLAAVITLWSSVFTSLEQGSVSLTLSHLKDELSFYSRVCANAPCSGKIPYTIFPTLNASLTSSANTVTITIGQNSTSIDFTKPVTSTLPDPLTGRGQILIRSDGSTLVISQ